KVSHTLPKGWRRVYLENFMEILTGLYSSGKKLDIIEFILENLNSENQLTLTQEQVMKATKVSRQTIVDTYKYLLAMDFMKKKGSVFVVNPKYVCAFGSDKKNRTIAINYSYDEPTLFD
ncbi:replication/maintenance protein RepL, partial [Campylobacter jejuni]|nr:replication/maintenance protein RepL [Campylobacter jejuni]